MLESSRGSGFVDSNMGVSPETQRVGNPPKTRPPPNNSVPTGRPYNKPSLADS